MGGIGYFLSYIINLLMICLKEGLIGQEIAIKKSYKLSWTNDQGNERLFLSWN